MENIHHRPIRKFGIDGIINDESSIMRLRAEYSKLLNSEMRLRGYVPRLDINEDFTIQYNIEKQYFEFRLSAYAIYVGKKKSKWISGIDETRVVYTQKSKLSEYLREVA